MDLYVPVRFIITQGATGTVTLGDCYRSYLIVELYSEEITKTSNDIRGSLKDGFRFGPMDERIRDQTGRAIVAALLLPSDTMYLRHFVFIELMHQLTHM